MDLSDASEKNPSDKTGVRSGDLPTSSVGFVVCFWLVLVLGLYCYNCWVVF
jgi:hypothetical protein